MTESIVPLLPADPVRIRELGPGEYDVLDAVFDGLSPISRYRRFHGAVPRMAPFMRARLGAVDGHSHIAVAAFAAGDPVGIARLIALGGGRAELAVEVVDAWQGMGIGTRLVRAVVERGRAAGHAEIGAEVLAENVAMRLLLASVFPELAAVDDGPEITYTAAVPQARRPAC
jgi:GNAT superfamily N-acetyltransferase